MTGRGHHIAAAGGGAGLFFWAAELVPLQDATVLGVACVLGGKAPDWLELPLWNGQGRLIPHRRITHWVLGWIAALGSSTFIDPPVSMAVAGFSIGCLIHLSGDLLTPMGVPVLHPWARTRGMQSRSPFWNEFLWVAGIWGAAVLPYWIYG